jgi:O-6-methylguanine DNA methyltransferase
MWLGAAIQNETIIATSFALNEKSVLENLLKTLPYNVPFQIVEKTDPFAERVLSAIKAVLNGRDVALKFNLNMRQLSDYAQRVLKCVFLVAVGYVTTYGEVAKAVGGSPRAVGRVMATNPFPPLVPCHRVVRSDFTLGGFGLGTVLKWKLLQRENRGYSQGKKIKVDGKSLSLFPINFLRKG